MKKLIIAALACASFACSAYHGRPGPFRHHYHHHHHGWRAAPFVAGAVIGSAVASAVPYRVWVPGAWVSTFDAYGHPMTVWRPGHWEYR